MQYNVLKFLTKRRKKVAEIDIVYRFKQPAWLRLYISKNTQKRTKAKAEFEQDWYKSLNIAPCGKPIEYVKPEPTRPTWTLGHLDSS